MGGGGIVLRVAHLSASIALARCFVPWYGPRIRRELIFYRLKSMFNKKSKSRGFTLIEILVVIAIIAILAAIVLVAINPGQRFRDARNSQRRANVESILNAIQQDLVDKKGISSCTAINSTPTDIGTGSGLIDLTGCLANYITPLPFDPKTGSAADTNYQVSVNANNQYTVSAPLSGDASEGSMSPIISITR